MCELKATLHLFNDFHAAIIKPKHRILRLYLMRLTMTIPTYLLHVNNISDYIYCFTNLFFFQLLFERLAVHQTTINYSICNIYTDNSPANKFKPFFIVFHFSLQPAANGKKYTKTNGDFIQFVSRDSLCIQ